jgi:hypothetical protein
LTHIRGVLGVPIVYIIRHLLRKMTPLSETMKQLQESLSTHLTTTRGSLAALSWQRTVSMTSLMMTSKFKDPLSQPFSLT